MEWTPEKIQEFWEECVPTGCFQSTALSSVEKLRKGGGTMKDSDKACFNCNSSRLVTFPTVGAESKADYYGFSVCESPNSQCTHTGHLTTLRHLCEHWEEFKGDKEGK